MNMQKAEEARRLLGDICGLDLGYLENSPDPKRSENRVIPLHIGGETAKVLSHFAFSELGISLRQIARLAMLSAFRKLFSERGLAMPPELNFEIIDPPRPEYDIEAIDRFLAQENLTSEQILNLSEEDKRRFLKSSIAVDQKDDDGESSPPASIH